MGTTKQSTPLFKTRFTAKNLHSRPRQSFEDSITVQGDVMTIQEMFKRAHAQGHEFTEGMYMDVENIQEINHLYRQGQDLTDLQAHGEHLVELKNKIDKSIEESKKAKAEADKKLEEEKRKEEIKIEAQKLREKEKNTPQKKD